MCSWPFARSSPPRRSTRRPSLLLALLAAFPTTAPAAVLTVGPGGDHATISSAIAIARESPDADEIRVRAGTYAETVAVVAGHAGDLLLTGGWNAGFTAFDPDPPATVVDAQGQNIALFLAFGEGQVTVRGFTFRGGRGLSVGAGARIALLGTADLTLADCHLVDNRIAGVEGGRGGGLALEAGGEARFLATRLRIERNVVEGPVAADAAGLDVKLVGFATGELRDIVVRDNVAIGPGSFHGGSIDMQSFAELTAHGLRFLDNTGSAGSESSQLGLRGFAGQLSLTDSVIAGGNANGLSILTATAAFAVAVANVTVADHAGAGLLTDLVNPAGRIDVSSSLFFGNGGPAVFDQGVTGSSNLDGIDPLFADPAARDYRLLAGSPAIDAVAADPPAGLADFDAAGNPRLAGAGVDVGAYEHGPSSCSSSRTVLCLAEGRFQVDVSRAGDDGASVEAEVVPLTADSGYVWFFAEANVEMLVKALDACAVNDRFWFFAGGLTDVGVSTRVTDTATGEIRVYRNPAGAAFQPVLDVDAFDSCSVAAGSAPRSRQVATVVRGVREEPTLARDRRGTVAAAASCVANETTLCLGNGRFAVTASWRSPEGGGDGHAGVLTADTGTFWFFSDSNLEIVLKVLDTCAINQHRWVYAAGLTDVEVTLSVTDTVSGASASYTNPLGTFHQPITDVEALPCS